MSQKAGIGLLFVFLFVFFFVPVVSLLTTAFTGEPVAFFEKSVHLEFGPLYKEVVDKANLTSIKELVTVKRYRRAGRNSLALAAIVATLASLLAIPLSLGLARSLFVWPKLFEFLILLPLATPVFFYAFALILLFSKYGVLAKIFGVSFFDPFSLAGLIVTQVTGLLPLAVLAQTPSFSLYSSGYNTIARALGSPFGFTTNYVWLPLNWSGILTGWVLVALRSLGDFVSPMLLTSARFRLLILEAWRDLAGSNWWPGASALCLELAAVALALLLCEKFLLNRERTLSQVNPLLGALGESAKPAAWMKRGLSLYGLFILSLPILIVVLIIIYSLGGLSEGGWTIKNYAEILPEAPGAIVNSLLLGFWVVAGALPAGLIAAHFTQRSRWLRYGVFMMLTLAFALPHTIYAIGLVGVFSQPPLLLHFTPGLLIIAVLITRMNYALRLLESAGAKLGFGWEDAARVMKASPLFAFRWVSWPYLRPAIAAGAILVGISALQDVSLAILIAPPRFYPLSLVIARYIADGLFAQASALSIMLMTLLVGLAALGLRRLSLFREAEF